MNHLDFGDEHCLPALALGTNEPIGLLPVDEETLVERTDVFNRRSPETQPGATSDVDFPPAEIVPVRHAGARERSPPGHPFLERKLGRDQIEELQLGPAESLNRSVGVLEQSGQRRHAGFLDEELPDRLEPASDLGDIRIEQQDELARTDLNPLVDRRRKTDVHGIRDDRRVWDRAFDDFGRAVSGRIVDDDEPSRAAAETLHGPQARGEDPRASVVDQDDVKGLHARARVPRAYCAVGLKLVHYARTPQARERNHVPFAPA